MPSRREHTRACFSSENARACTRTHVHTLTDYTHEHRGVSRTQTLKTSRRMFPTVAASFRLACLVTLRARERYSREALIADLNSNNSCESDIGILVYVCNTFTSRPTSRYRVDEEISIFGRQTYFLVALTRKL